jgi:tetratricopeptide (TPR) repeat protein
MPSPESEPGIIVLDSSALIEDPGDVAGERASLIDAALNARTAAMLTGTHGVVAMPLSRADVRLPSPADLLDEGASWEAREGESESTALLRARAQALTTSTDPVTRMRAELELAHAQLDGGDADAARESATAASQRVEHAPSAHALLRVVAAGRERAQLDEQLAHVDHLADHVSDALVRADFLAEKGRLLEARSGASVESAAAYSAALALVPDHAGALAGLEAALEATGRWPELAALLGRLAGLAGGGGAAEPAATAWLHVERALILDRRLGDSGTARSVLEHAIELAPGIGPVRQATLDHAAVHRDDARLGTLLESEAALESDVARAKALELDGALALLHAGDVSRATKLLEHAHARGKSSVVVDVRVSSELARLFEKAGRDEEALRVRKAALAMVTGPRVELLELRALVATAERAGEMSEAVLALERARVLDADDATLLEELDRLLVAAGRHDARAVLWVREAALADDVRTKTHALLLAAEASGAAGREADAARHREAAWLADPSAPGVFDALAEGVAASSREAVAARVALYTRAAERANDEGKRLHYLEKIAWLWDDVAGEVALAAQAYEDVLAIDPKRRSAIAGLASAAARARDGRRLARALLAEADVADDVDVKTEVRVRAGEALAEVDPERALALATEVAKSKNASLAMRARELLTRLHATAGRWELVASTLADRGRAEKRKGPKLALALSQAAVLAQRLAAPDRALSVLEATRETAPDDPAIASAIVASLEAMGDDDALRKWLERLAGDASDVALKVSYLVRAAEIAERRQGGDEDAVRLYICAREAMPDERLVIERLVRLSARTELPSEAQVALPLVAAIRSLDTGRAADGTTAETLLASGARDFATLRVAERLARSARSAPQLANALALMADATSGPLAMRALSALAAVVAWTLPEGGELAPWDRLLALGSRDAVVLDDLVRRARPKLLAGDGAALELATEATKRRLEGAADDTERVVLRIELARMHRRGHSISEAADSCREALAVDPTSAGAAVVLGHVASDLGDRWAAIVAVTTLGEITRRHKARAALLRDAADLSAVEGDAKGAALLLERALEADPDNVVVAARLAQVQAKERAWADLARVLRRGLFAAKSAEAVVPMAAELSDVAKAHLSDPQLAIEALERSRLIAPDHVPALFLLAELYIGQRTWDESLRALADVIARTDEKSEKLIALVGRASILGRVLGQPAEAQKELRAALAIDGHDLRALRGLLALPLEIAADERADLLSRLVVAETQPEQRFGALLELADTRRGLGDGTGAEGALIEAASIRPDATMLERLRHAAGNSREAAARIIGRAVGRAREAGNAPGVAWLATLGELDLDLGRLDEAVEHFEGVLRLDPFREAERRLLARAYSGKGRHEAAAAALTPLLEGASGAGLLDASFVRQLDDSLVGAGRTQQALVARELRAVAGDLDENGQTSLRSRRQAGSLEGEPLGASTLRAFVMPQGVGKHPIWDVAAITLGISGKLARVALQDQGASPRDRIKPRAVHPVRQLFDRIARVFEVAEIELAVSDHVVAPLVACEDDVWVIVPSSFGDWPEPHAIAALARPLTRIALGVPWLGALPPEETIAILVAFARQAAPNAGATPRERVEALVMDYDARARRAIDRKRKKSLEDLESSITRAPSIAIDAFANAALRAEARAAFLVTGDLRAALAALALSEGSLADALRAPSAGALAAVLTHPVSRDLVGFAMGGEATALRRSLGTLWS